MPPGNQITLNFALGLNIGPAFLAYFSLSLVTDKDGGYQVYFTKRDQDYNQGTSTSMGEFESGPAEKNHPTQLLAVGGVSITYGAIYGAEFEERGTMAYKGQAVATVGGLGFLAGDKYKGYDPVKGDYSSVSGWDIGIGIGGPLTMGEISTTSIPLTERHSLPPAMLPGCRSAGMCGSLPSPISYIEALKQTGKNFRNWVSKKIFKPIQMD